MQLLELQKKVSSILRAHGIKRASVFGSVSRNEDRPDGDVDKNSFLKNLKTQSAVIMQLTLIGEISKKISAVGCFSLIASKNSLY